MNKYEGNLDIGYRIGRAIFLIEQLGPEKARLAIDKYWSLISEEPARNFPLMLQMLGMMKLETRAADIVGALGALPQRLTAEEGCRLIIGYHCSRARAGRGEAV